MNIHNDRVLRIRGKRNQMNKSMTIRIGKMYMNTNYHLLCFHFYSYSIYFRIYFLIFAFICRIITTHHLMPNQTHRHECSQQETIHSQHTDSIHPFIPLNLSLIFKAFWISSHHSLSLRRGIFKVSWSESPHYPPWLTKRQHNTARWSYKSAHGTVVGTVPPRGAQTALPGSPLQL